MKFIGLKDNIISGILTATRFSQPRGNLLILSNLYLQVKKTGLVIKATNLESGVIIEVRGISEQEGDFTINAKFISEYLVNIPEGKIELEVIDKKLRISTGKYQAIIKGIEAADFPILPEVEKGDELEMEISKFSSALSKTIFATSAQEIRQELSGLYFSFNKNILTIAATDTFRLAEQRISFTGLGERQVIIPHKTLQEILKICEQTNEKTLKIILSEGEMMFQIKPIKVFSRLIEGQYPEYQAIIPQQINTKVELRTSEILQAIKTASLFSQNGLFDVSLQFDAKKGIVKVSSQRFDIGEHHTEIDAVVSGQDTEIILNYRYLLDYLSRMNENEMEFLIASSSQPIKIRPKGERDYFYLIMPIHQ